MSKRRGFTLTEIVVVIALTSLVLAMVGGCLYFVSTYSGTLISKSEELTKVQTIETYLRGQTGLDNESEYINYENYEKLLKFAIENGDLINQDGKTVIKNTGFSELKITYFYIDSDNNKKYEITEGTTQYFVECQLFKEGSTAPDYTFILGIVEKHITP